MAWDTHRTRQRLLDAGVEEFSAHGLAGARIDRIAHVAGVNKERIYQYFGSKDQLFDTVLETELDRMFDAVPLTATTPGHLVEYAGALFDHYDTRPHLARLLHFEGLERGAGRIDMDSPRTRRSLAKAKIIATALGPGASLRDGANLFLTIIALATSWQVTPQLTRMFLDDPGPQAERSARREALVQAVAGLTGAPQTSAG